MDMPELLTEWKSHNNVHSFDQDSGIAKLNKLMQDIGYMGHPYRYGEPILEFLADNSGACNALVEWIGEQDVPEWAENLESHLPAHEDEGEE